MKFTLTMNCDNDNFNPHPQVEIASILRIVATRVLNANLALNQAPHHWAGYSQAILDGSGNNIGYWAVKK